MNVEEAFDLAVEWMDAGIECFPIALNKLPTKVEKEPLTRHGHNSATLDHGKFKVMLRQAAKRLEIDDKLVGWELGVGCHSRDEVLFDFDIKNGAKGAEVQERLKATYGEEMGKVAYRSISGGVNWLMRKPDLDAKISNTSPWSELGVDLRSDNGWFVPPGVFCSWGAWEWQNGGLEDLEETVIPDGVWELLKVAGEHAAPAMTDEVEQWLDANRLTHMNSPLMAKQLEDHLESIAKASNRHPAMWDALVWIRHQDRMVDRRAAFEAIDGAWRARMKADGESSRSEECRERLAFLVGSSLEWERDNRPDDPTVDPPEMLDEEREMSKSDWILSKLLTTDELSRIPRPAALVDGWIFRDSLAWLIGPSGAGKSFVAVDLAMQIGSGGGWWHGNRTEGGRVLYVVAEGAAGMSLRTEAWKKHHGIDTEVDVHWLPSAINLYDAEWADAMITAVAELKPDLVIIDTMARASVGAEENSSKDAGMMIQTFDRMRVAAGGACILLVHHTGKQTEAGGRGSSAFKGAIESELTVSGELRALVLSNTKQKNVEECRPLNFAGMPVELGIGADGEVATSVVLYQADPAAVAMEGGVTATDRLLMILEAHTMPDLGLTSKQWFELAQEGDQPIPTSTYYKCRKALLEDGKVEQRGAKFVLGPNHGGL